MASSSHKRSISREVIAAVYTVLLLLWFRGVVHDVNSPWSHLFLVGAIAIFLCVVAGEKT